MIQLLGVGGCCFKCKRIVASENGASLNEMIDSFTLSNEAVTQLKTDSTAQRKQSGGTPQVTRREDKEEQLRQNWWDNWSTRLGACEGDL